MKFTVKHLEALIDLKENRSAGVSIDSSAGWDVISQLVFLELIKADLVNFSVNSHANTKPELRILINNRGQDIIQQALHTINQNTIIEG